MPKWKYEVESVKFPDLHFRLNEAGKKGWRAIFIKEYAVTGIPGDHYMVIFEREIPEPQATGQTVQNSDEQINCNAS